MNELKNLFDKYPQTYRLSALALLALLCYILFLKALSLPLTGQKQRLLEQERHLKLASLLPHNWQIKVKTLDTSDLIDQLSRNWRGLMNNQNLQCSQVNRQQLKLKISASDEQSLLQWLLAMQGQYAFKVQQMQMHPTPAKPGLVDAEFLLQII